MLDQISVHRDLPPPNVCMYREIIEESKEDQEVPQLSVQSLRLTPTTTVSLVVVVHREWEKVDVEVEHADKG